MENSAIILAGGSSSRFGRDKGLLRLVDKPLIKHVLDAVESLVNEKIVVVSSKAQAENYVGVLDSDVVVLVDADKLDTPLIGALTGLKTARGEYSLLLSCDIPFVSREILSLLLSLCINKSAAIPRYPNRYTEPLHAAYRTRPAFEAAEHSLSQGNMRMQAMMDKLRGVRYISTLVLQQLDPQLKTFFNINTMLDLKKAETMLKRPNPRSGLM